MSTNIRCICVFITVMISGCALQPGIRPVTDPAMRFRGNGYSALPPQGKDWYIQQHTPYVVNFAKLSPENMERYHTFAATVMGMKPEAQNVNSPSEFSKAIEQLLVRTLTEGRFRLMSIKVAPYGAEGSYCSQYDIVQEERDNPSAPGVVLEITAHGFFCLDVSSDFMINASYSERKPQGSKSFLDIALKQEADGFLKDVVVTPLR